jgi:hypothetical protein
MQRELARSFIAPISAFVSNSRARPPYGDTGS